MWIFFAIGSSFFAGITAILAKCGIRKTDSDVATAIRTIVVLLFSWLMVLITGAWSGITTINGKTLLFLVLSGLATGASWLCYFRALQMGDINKVVPIDKSSTILTILLALIFLHEGLTWGKVVSVILIGVGTMLMISKKDAEKVLNAFVETVQEAVKADDKVQLVGFGTFESRARSAREGKNPQTGEKIQIAACKVPVFKAGKAFKDLLK